MPVKALYTPSRSLAVANRFIEMSKRDSRPLTLMKLLKIVYFAHGWHLALWKQDPLIDDIIEAWKFGPVAPSIYHSFKEYGSSDITDFGREVDITRMEFVQPVLEATATLEAFLSKIWEVYGPMTAFQLSELTHQRGTPWYKVWFDEKGCERKGAAIPDDLIYEYFKNKLAPEEPVAERTSPETNQSAGI